MNKKLLGIIIPYYKNSEECEIAFKQLMEKLYKQLTDDMILYIFEDGQITPWINEIPDKGKMVIVDGDGENHGVSYARNQGIDYLENKVEYITFIDSDDDVDDDYLLKLCEYCADKTHEIIETKLKINDCNVDSDRTKIRSAVWSVAFKTDIIGKHRFDEKMSVHEDTKFANEVCDLSKHRKKICPTTYHYLYGKNPNSLIKRYNRNEIGKER